MCKKFTFHFPNNFAGLVRLSTGAGMSGFHACASKNRSHFIHIQLQTNSAAFSTSTMLLGNFITSLHLFTIETLIEVFYSGRLNDIKNEPQPLESRDQLSLINQRSYFQTFSRSFFRVQGRIKLCS